MAYIFSKMQLAGNQKTEWTWYCVVLEKIRMPLTETSSNAFIAHFEDEVINGAVEWSTTWAVLSQGWKISSSVLCEYDCKLPKIFLRAIC